VKEIEFNLLEEPWIRVRTPDCTLKEVSLTDALLHAHEYADLAGELPTQDVAVLRLLLAVLQTIFYRVDLEGNPSPLEDEEDALDRWGQLWEKKMLPETPILDYLSAWRDRFWLFHPERPFYQVAEAQIGTEYGAKKLNGEISESENKYRLFQSYGGAKKDSLTYSQAARWLLYLNGFDDTSAKPKGKGLPSVGAGWLGKIGLFLARGNTLAETLLLNLVLLKDGQELWSPPCPYWELNHPRSGERTEIPLPDNQAALLTLQSRRLFLYRKEDQVTGYRLIGGDYFERENAFCEQMTIWRKAQEKKNSPLVCLPLRHDPAKQMWREFPSTFAVESSAHIPGIVQWIITLRNYIDRNSFIQFISVGAVYGDKDFFINDTFTDLLSFHRFMLESKASGTLSKISQEVIFCEEIADAVGALSIEIAQSAGGIGAPKAAKERFYFSIDQPFRQWLADLDPEEDIDEAVLSWRSQAKRIARQVGQALVEEAGPSALVGRCEKIAKANKEIKVYHAAPKAFHWFLWELKKIYGEKGGIQP
jgi:CRISPR system Cascade subunit CasA